VSNQPVPIEPGDVISEAFDIYRDQAGTLLPLAFGIFAIEAVLTLVIGPFVAIVGLLLGILFQGMVVELVRDVQDGRRDHSIGSIYNRVSELLLMLVAISLLYAIGVLIGLVALIIPGLYLLTIWAVTIPVAVVERPGIVGSFGRSRELVKGHGWSVFLTILIVFVLVFVVGLVAGMISAGLGEVGQIVVQWIVDGLTAPVWALTAGVLYFALVKAAGTAGAATPAAPAPGPAPTAPSAPSGFAPPVPEEPKRNPERPDSVPPPGMS